MPALETLPSNAPYIDYWSASGTTGGIEITVTVDPSDDAVPTTTVVAGDRVRIGFDLPLVEGDTIRVAALEPCIPGTPVVVRYSVGPAAAEPTTLGPLTRSPLRLHREARLGRVHDEYWIELYGHPPAEVEIWEPYLEPGLYDQGAEVLSRVNIRSQRLSVNCGPHWPDWANHSFHFEALSPFDGSAIRSGVLAAALRCADAQRVDTGGNLLTPEQAAADDARIEELNRRFNEERADGGTSFDGGLANPPADGGTSFDGGLANPPADSPAPRGGCTTGGGPASPWTTLLATAACLLLARRRRRPSSR